ncbi:CAP domain-containing protein [uncultured Oscillibacter sp.]|uniref:CAP domain-containing protein n=1 Tax=uncultured Oscillibacter sp. TaxID=876091 RepID=UPI002627E9D2|nr:CAP domain-containing protein [uncultured Oscillibacter sp.]
MKKKDIGIALACMVLGAVLCGTAVPAKAAELSASVSAQAALKVSSYKGDALPVGERSMLVVSPYGTSVTAVSSNPGVIALEQVSGCCVMVAKAAGTAEVSITDNAGNSAAMTMTVLGEKASSTPLPGEGFSPAQTPADSDPVVNSEWSHNPDTDLSANMDIRLEMVRLINQVRQEHGLPELPVDDRLMNATQDISTQHFREHTQYEREAVIAYGWLYGGCHNLTCFSMVPEEETARTAVTNWVNSPGHLQSMLREDVTCIGVGVTMENNTVYCHMYAGDPTGHGIL